MLRGPGDWRDSRRGPAVLVRLKRAGAATPGALAATLYPPVTEFALKMGLVAVPPATVRAVAVAPPPTNVPLAPLAGAAKVTLTPSATGLPLLSLTRAVKGAVKALPTATRCGVPVVATMPPGGPGRFVIVNVAGVAPLTVAVTLYAPAVVFAVKAVAVATPSGLVVTVALPVKAPLAPLAGAAKTTEAPAITFPKASRTVTASGAVKAVPTLALCGVVPGLAIMLAAAAGVTVMPLCVPTIEGETISCAVMDCIPAVFSVTGAVPMPCANVMLNAGATKSLLLSETAPVYVVAVLPMLSFAVTVTVWGAPATVVPGKPERTKVVAAPAMIGSDWAFDVPPPGAGLTTVILAAPGVVRRPAGIVAFTCVPDTYAVVRPVVLKTTCDVGTKCVPFTVSVAVPFVAAAVVGERPVIVGTGLLTVTVRRRSGHRTER